MTPTLKYYNQTFYINEIEFSNSVVKQTKPDLALDNKVKEVFYQEYSGKNYIIFDNDEKQDLSNYEEQFDQIILFVYYFQFEHNELIFKQQTENINTPATTIKITDLFENGLSEKEQQEKISILKEAYPSIEFTNELYFNNLDKIKKSLLKSSDWTQLPDVQESFNEEQKQEWIKYRATLRLLDEVKDPLTVRIPLSPKI
jgi:hypothetical protein